jgi:hypothetical protein
MLVLDVVPMHKIGCPHSQILERCKGLRVSCCVFQSLGQGFLIGIVIADAGSGKRQMLGKENRPEITMGLEITNNRKAL